MIKIVPRHPKNPDIIVGPGKRALPQAQSTNERFSKGPFFFFQPIPPERSLDNLLSSEIEQVGSVHRCNFISSCLSFSLPCQVCEQHRLCQLVPTASRDSPTHFGQTSSCDETHEGTRCKPYKVLSVPITTIGCHDYHWLPRLPCIPSNSERLFHSSIVVPLFSETLVEVWPAFFVEKRPLLSEGKQALSRKTLHLFLRHFVTSPFQAIL